MNNIDRNVKLLDNTNKLHYNTYSTHQQFISTPMKKKKQNKYADTNSEN